MAARASIVGACETSVGKVREHNEDSHFLDVNAGLFAVCDGMGGHAAGEVASALAVRVIHEHWSNPTVERIADTWIELGTPEARKQMLAAIQAGVIAAHDAIVAEAQRDKSKHGMGTTVVGALVLGGEIVFAQCGDSRAYLVRDNIAMQLTEDHTLLARLLAAGVDVDTSNEGARFKSMLTNALGIGQDCKAATFIVPITSGDRFLLCSDGITEYVQEVEIGEVLSQAPSPARAAQKLVELALSRGGADNATALVVKVIEAGETARPVAQLVADNKAIAACPLWGKATPQGQLRALRIALPRDHVAGERIPAQTLGDRVAWIIVEGEVELEHGVVMGPGGLLYPEALAPARALPDKHGLGIARKDVRALALRADDFRELCADDSELGEQLGEALERLLGGAAPVDSASTRAETVGPRERTTELGMGVVPTDTAVPQAVADTPPPRVAPDAANRPRTRQTDPGLAATLPPLPHAAAPRPRNRSEDGATLPDGLTGARAAIERAATQERPGLVRAAASAGADALARGPTDPQIPIPIPRSRSELIVPSALRAEAEARIDEVFADITDERPRAAKPLPPPSDELVEPGGDEITIEAEPPPLPLALPRPPMRPVMRSDDDEPEISIERTVEIEVDQPFDDGREREPSSPEILVIQSNRPITANDAKHVAGTIESPKRQT